MRETAKTRRWARLVALRVLEALEKNNMTQSDLADKLGVSRQHVSKIVKGEENFSFATIEKLENALDIELMTVYGPGESLVKTINDAVYDMFTAVAPITHVYYGGGYPETSKTFGFDWQIAEQMTQFGTVYPPHNFMIQGSVYRPIKKNIAFWKGEESVSTHQTIVGSTRPFSKIDKLEYRKLEMS